MKPLLEGERALKLCAEMTDISVAQILGAQQSRRVVYARWTVVIALHRRGWSASNIGRLLNRDHTTILYALREAPFQVNRQGRDLEQRLTASVVVRDWLKVA
jgi:chromosomal replication initiation ATPase DnaA